MGDVSENGKKPFEWSWVAAFVAGICLLRGEHEQAQVALLYAIYLAIKEHQ